MSKKVQAAAPKKAAQPKAPPIPEGSAEAAVAAASEPVTDRCALARAKMRSLIEIYTPSNQTREPALAALFAELEAFEQAMREDEAHQWRVQLIEAQAPGVYPNVATREEHLQQAGKPLTDTELDALVGGVKQDGPEGSPPTADTVGTDANGSPAV